MATATAARKKKTAGKKLVPAEPVKFSVPLPPEVHLALAIASAKTGLSNSTLVRTIVEERFGNGTAGDALRILKPAEGASDWKRVSVFLPPALKDKATHEVQRQHGGNEDKRFSGSLASAIAALVAQTYTPKYKF